MYIEKVYAGTLNSKERRILDIQRMKRNIINGTRSGAFQLKIEDS